PATCRYCFPVMAGDAVPPRVAVALWMPSAGRRSSWRRIGRGSGDVSRRSEAMLPPVEVDTLITAVFEAVDLAAEGPVPDGYQVLLLGKKALEGEANCAPWAEDLEGRWDAALERYADRYGVGRA